MSRRRALHLGAAAAAATALPAIAVPDRPPLGLRPVGASPLDAAALRPDIRPRSDWAGDDNPPGQLEVEDDVRFLLVHHTASTNDYGPDDVVDQLLGFHRFHTGPEKGWPDIAYNFLIDRFGGIWEGRAGSADGPVRGDATGGSQGYALLCSLIGDHAAQPVTDAARTSLVQLLAWLGATYEVDTAPGAMVSFPSRGSSRWPAETEVVARTISGHRDMSTTTCPGDQAYALLETDIPTAVWALQSSAALPGGPDDPDGAPATTDTVDSTTSPAPDSTDPPVSDEAAPSTTTAAPPPTDTESSAPDVGGDGDGLSPWYPALGAGGAVVVAGGAWAAFRRRAWRKELEDWEDV